MALRYGDFFCFVCITFYFNFLFYFSFVVLFLFIFFFRGAFLHLLIFLIWIVCMYVNVLGLSNACTKLYKRIKQKKKWEKNKLLTFNQLLIILLLFSVPFLCDFGCSCCCMMCKWRIEYFAAVVATSTANIFFFFFIILFEFHGK